MTLSDAERYRLNAMRSQHEQRQDLDFTRFPDRAISRPGPLLDGDIPPNLLRWLPRNDPLRMRRRRERLAWFIFGAGCALCIVGLLWVLARAAGL